MALTGRRDDHQETPTPAVETCEPALRLTSDVMIDGQADLLSHFDQICKWWLHEQRDAIRSARQLLAEMERCQDLLDVLRVQHKWLFEWLRRIIGDSNALSRMTFDYSRRLTKWTDEAAHAVVTAAEPRKRCAPARYRL